MDINCTYTGEKPKKITLAMIRKGINIIEASMPDKMIERIEISPETMRILASSVSFRASTELCNSLFGMPFSVNVDLKVPYRPIYFKGIM